MGQYPDWPRFYSHTADLWTYLDKVCSVFDLRKYMTFCTEITGCYWQEDKGQWAVKLRQQLPGQKPREFEDHCHILLHAAGVFCRPQVSHRIHHFSDVPRLTPIVYLPLVVAHNPRPAGQIPRPRHPHWPVAG